MKRIFGIIFVLIVLAAFTPPGCFAEDDPKSLTCTYLYNNQGRLAEGSYKLVNNNCTYSGNITLNEDVTLDLNGNSLESTGSINCSSQSCSLTITDNSNGEKGVLKVGVIDIHGSLEVSGGTVNAAGSGNTGIFVSKNIIISGGTVKASGGIYGIQANGGITISGGTVEMASGSEYGISAGGDITISGTVTKASGVTSGIYANGDITIESGGTVKEASGEILGGINAVNITIKDGGTVTEASSAAYGIHADKSITISGGTVAKASGDHSGIDADNGPITIESGSTVNATGTNGPGIYAEIGSIIISGGTVTASGDQNGIHAGNSITISGDNTKVTAKATDTDGTGIYAEAGSITIESGGTVEMASGSQYGIYAGSGGITIKGDNTQVNATGSGDTGIYAYIGDISISGGTVTASGGAHGIYAVSGGITIKGDNTQVTASGTSDIGTGIDADYGPITISGGTVSATGGQHGIHAFENITINGGTVKASGTSDSGIYARGKITISGGSTVEEASSYHIGISAGSGITISEGGTVTAAGETQAVSGIVKNAVLGIGWEDAAGTQGDTGIPVSESGQDLPSYKKVRFPASTAVVTFTVVNGAWDDGTTNEIPVTLYCAQGDDLKLAADQIPSAGSKPKSGFITGSWNQTPTSEMVFTENTTFTYTYAKKTTAVVDPSPAAKDLTYNGIEQELVTAGKASGGTMQYALGTDTAPTGVWGTAIPTGTKADTYYIWYKAVGDTDHNDSDPASVPVTIAQASIENAAVDLSDTSFDFTGSEQHVTVKSVTLGGVTLTADTDYQVKDGTSGTEKRTYTVTVIGIGGYTGQATATWSIGLGIPKIVEPPTASAVTFGQTLAESTLTGGKAAADGNTVAGRFAWKDPALSPAVSDSGTTKYAVVFTPADTENYGTAECEVTLTVNKAESAATAPAAKMLTFDGSPQELVTAGTAEGGTMQYALGEESSAPETGWSSSIPTGTGAGTYFVWYKVAGDQSHSDSPAGGPVTVTIAKESMELPAEISVVQGNGDKGVPVDVKAQTIRLTIRLKQNGGLKLSSAPIELAVTPGGNVKPVEISATFTPNVTDFNETCGNYEYEVLVTPGEVKADIAGAGDDGPAYLLKAAAGSPDCEKFVVTLYWNSKAAAPAPEVIRVVALPEDEIGAYKLRDDGTKEYLLFQTYDICMAWLGSDELCRGSERCYHK